MLYFTVDGRCIPEKTKLNSGLIEMADGYHPITNNSVWQDARRMKDALLILIQGVRGPYGATMEDQDIARLLYDLELQERAFKKVRVSKMWFRALQRLGEGFLKYGLYVFIIFMVIYYAGNAMLQGAA